MKKTLKIISVLAVLAVIAIVGGLIWLNMETDLPKLYFEGDITEMLTKEDVRDIEVTYQDGDTTFSGFASLKVQGSSSLSYDKKNYTIKFYADEAHEEKLRVNVKEGWGEQYEYCLKANWIDKTHSRNVVTANIVTEVQQQYGLLEEAPANGAIDGFPVEIYSNGEFWGLYTFNIPKADWQFAMDEDNPDHIVICGEHWSDPCYFYELPNFEDWSVEVGEERDETLEKMNRLFDFVMNSTDEEFKAHFEEYINLDAALNYHIIANFAYLADNSARNMLIATYDGEVWYPSLYDLDSSWGAYVSGWELYDYENEPLNYGGSSNLWKRLEENFGQELSARYSELRQGLLTKAYVMEQFEEFRDSIPLSTRLREKLRWGITWKKGLPGYGLHQIGEFLDTMIPINDAYYASLG